jgi:hypothetical protein
MAAMTIDVGYMYLVRQELQSAADAGALAAAWTLFDDAGALAPVVAVAQGQYVANLNAEEAVAGITLGWIEDPSDPASPFVPAGAPPVNAVRATALRTAETGNPVDLFFAGILGTDDTDIEGESVVALSRAGALDGVPVALRAPGFGPIDPTIVEMNPGKEGPSEPDNGFQFQIGEEVTLFAFGKGKKAPVHLILNTNECPGEVEIGKVLKDEKPPVPLALGEEIDVVGDGTGHDGLGKKLAQRLEDDDPDNDTVIVPIVDVLPDTRDDKGILDGNVKVVDFLAVHLEEIQEIEVPDPKDPEDKTINIEILVGTVVQVATSGTPTDDDSGMIAGTSVHIPELIR